MKYLVVIPARGGSKGIPHKNIYPISGKPLLEYTLESMKNVVYEGDLVVSTDDDAISQIARKYEEVMVIHRPDSISGDTARTEDALLHAIEYMREQYGREYDAIVTMQATSPLRKSCTIQNIMVNYEQAIESYDALLTLTEDRSDFWILNEDNSFRRLYPDAPRRRQDRQPIYAENSAIYITSTRSLCETQSVLGRNVQGYVIDYEESVDINEMKDIYLVESLLKKEKIHECNDN